jgi:adenosylhomocysteine nucleosidase
MRLIGIIGAMELEVKIIKEALEEREEFAIAGFKYYKGQLNGVEIVLTSCGVGKVNAAACTQILIDRFNVDSIVNTGIAGSLHDDVKICDIVISDSVTYHDVRKGQMKSCFPYKEYFQADEQLREFISSAIEEIVQDSSKYHIGKIVTGEAFISNDQEKAIIIESYSPLCVEMEGAAIGHVASINNVPFIVVRSISDNADNNATINYETFEQLSANKSANLVLNMIYKISQEQANKN